MLLVNHLFEKAQVEEGIYQGGGGDLIPKLMEKAMIKRMAMLNDFTINPLMHMPQNGQKHFNNLAAFILWIEEYF